jgi:hypothetical protein
MPYGFSKGFIASGDLRFTLVERHKGQLPDGLFCDKLISVDEDKKVIKYDEGFSKRRNTYIAGLQQNRSALNNLYPGATAILCGAGVGYNPTLVRDAHSLGAIIISLGSNIKQNNYAHFWTGSDSPVDYPPEALQRVSTVKIIPAAYNKDRYFNETVKTFAGGSVDTFPGTVLVNIDDPAYTDIKGDMPANSFYYGLTLAIQLGITDIVLTGVELGVKTKGAWNYPGISLTEEQIAEKQTKYALIQDDFNTRLRANLQAEHCMRLYSDANSKSISDTISSLSADIILKDLQRKARRSVQPVFARSKYKMSARREISALSTELEAKAIRPAEIVPVLDKLMIAVPEVFDTKELRQIRDQYYALLATPSACTSCALNRIAHMPHTAFTHGLRGPKAEPVLAFWKQYFPNKTCIRIGKDWYIVPWEADIQERYTTYLNS